jgi:hypothetical protein
LFDFKSVVDGMAYLGVDLVLAMSILGLFICVLHNIGLSTEIGEESSEQHDHQTHII